MGDTPTSPWIFQAIDIPALVMPSCENGATSPSSQITCKTRDSLFDRSLYLVECISRIASSWT